MKDSIEFINHFKIIHFTRTWNPATWFRWGVSHIEMYINDAAEDGQFTPSRKIVYRKRNSMNTHGLLMLLHDGKYELSHFWNPGTNGDMISSHFTKISLVELSPDKLESAVEWIRNHGKDGFFIVNHGSDDRRMIPTDSHEGRLLKLKRMASHGK